MREEVSLKQLRDKIDELLSTTGDHMVCVYDNGIELFGDIRLISGEHEDYYLISSTEV